MWLEVYRVTENMMRWPVRGIIKAEIHRVDPKFGSTLRLL